MVAHVSGQTSEQEAEIWARLYNQQAEVIWSSYTSAEWIYNTDLTDENEQKAVSSP